MTTYLQFNSRDRSAYQSILFGVLLLIIPLMSTAQTGVDHWETVVFNDDIWSYTVGASAPPVNWMQPQFDDRNWPKSSGGFGYGDGDDNTIIPTTLSIFIRINFELRDTSKINMAVLHADYDDAFVAYLNGTEIARGNFGGPNTTLAYNESPPTDHEAALYRGGVPEAYAIYPQSFDQLVKEGENTLAIQVNNFLITSSDLSSNFFLSLGINDNSMEYAPTPDWFYTPFISTHLPLIRIQTFEQEIVDDPRIVANMQIVDNGPGANNFIDDPATDYDGQIAIEIRGASSQLFDKKNYGFETQDQNGDNNNVSLLGMPEENDWILHGPYSDKSLIRNALTFQMGRNMMDYASRTRFCELMINNDYRGIYLLMEKIKRDKSRVDISNLRPVDVEGDELTGGYVFQIDRDNPDIDEDGWYSPHGSNPFYAYHSPSYDQLLPVQRNYIRNWMTSFESAMQQPNFAFTFENFIDVPSFIDYFLINELTKHIDAFKLSFYMYKRKDSNGGKLYMGPIWDFNLGYSNFDFGCSPEPDGWIYPCISRAFWLDRIITVSSVRNKMYCRWKELRQGELSTVFLLNSIDELVEELGPAVDQNFDRFSILGEYVWPNVFIGDTHDEEIEFLKNWLVQRLNWMDNNMFGDPNTDCDALVDINEIEATNYLDIYPNPFTNQLNFTIDAGSNRNGEVFLYDVLGNLIIHFNPFHQSTVNLSTLSSGLYFYEYRVNDQLLQHGKLVKQ